MEHTITDQRSPTGTVRRAARLHTGRAYVVHCSETDFPVTRRVYIFVDVLDEEFVLVGGWRYTTSGEMPELCQVRKADVYELPEQGYKNKEGKVVQRAQWESDRALTIVALLPLRDVLITK